MTLTLSAVYVLCKFIKYLKLKIYYLELEKKIRNIVVKAKTRALSKNSHRRMWFWFSLTSERIPRLTQKLITPMGFREAAKKVLFVIAGPLWPYPPPPSLMAGRTFFSSVPKVPKKVIFALMARPPPPPLYGPAI